MVTVGDVDEDLNAEIEEECSKHGAVKKVHVHIDRNRDGSAPPPDALAKIFVEFEETAGVLCDRL